MAKKSGSKKKKPQGENPDIKNICRNRRAFHEYTILETIECGLVLTGTEVKSLRDRAPTLDDAYARIKERELWLYGCDIPEYTMGNLFNHKPMRPRKLLLHKREITKFADKANQQGFTLVPTRMYFKKGWAKVEIAMAKGKQLHDKRETQKKKDAQREIQREMNRRR
ncbi:MAG: SsrA-binding protein SmpB [Gemmataceae bacterium]